MRTWIVWAALFGQARRRRGRQVVEVVERGELLLDLLVFTVDPVVGLEIDGGDRQVHHLAVVRLRVENRLLENGRVREQRGFPTLARVWLAWTC